MVDVVSLRLQYYSQLFKGCNKSKDFLVHRVSFGIGGGVFVRIKEMYDVSDKVVAATSSSQTVDFVDKGADWRHVLSYTATNEAGEGFG